MGRLLIVTLLLAIVMVPAAAYAFAHVRERRLSPIAWSVAAVAFATGALIWMGGSAVPD